MQHFECVDSELVEDQAQFVHQCDIHVPLDVLDHLGRLGNFDAAGLMGAGRDDLGVKAVDSFGHFRRAATGDFADGGQTVCLVAGVDPLRAVAAEEIDVEFQAAALLQHRHADFFGSSRVDRGFVNHHGAFGQGTADRLASADQR